MVIKLKTNEAVHGKNMLLTKTGQKGYIFLTKLRYTKFDSGKFGFGKAKQTSQWLKLNEEKLMWFKKLIYSQRHKR